MRNQATAGLGRLGRRPGREIRLHVRRGDPAASARAPDLRGIDPVLFEQSAHRGGELRFGAGDVGRRARSTVGLGHRLRWRREWWRAARLADPAENLPLLDVLALRLEN